MVSVKTPYLIKKLFYSLIWDIKNVKKEIFITFDDGPNPTVTPKVLEILKKYSAEATFFCLGRNVERYPDIFKQIKREGHSVGNHTYSHLKGWITSNKEYYDDIELANTYIASNLFRPPYGKIKRSQLKYLRKYYNIIMWDVMSSDYNKVISKEKCLSNVINHVRPGSIIVFHDSEKANGKMLFALPKVLEKLSKENYIFSKIHIPEISRKPVSGYSIIKKFSV